MWMLSKTHVNWPGLAWRYGLPGERFFLTSKTGCSRLILATAGAPEAWKQPGQKRLNWLVRRSSIPPGPTPGSDSIFKPAFGFTVRLSRAARVAYPNLFSVHVGSSPNCIMPVSYTHLRAHETVLDLVCRLLL